MIQESLSITSKKDTRKASNLPRRRRRRCARQGIWLDGVPARALARALEHMSDLLREVLDASLASERFPECWESGKLVLLRKPGWPADSVAASRSIVLLDEAVSLDIQGWRMYKRTWKYQNSTNETFEVEVNGVAWLEKSNPRNGLRRSRRRNNNLRGS